jgi:hypothetical protein
MFLILVHFVSKSKKVINEDNIYITMTYKKQTKQPKAIELMFISGGLEIGRSSASSTSALIFDRFLQ